jgi:DNA-binding transcriptional regulator GbsR (MarR family)
MPKENFLYSVLTEISKTSKLGSMKLKPVAERFVLHWGEMGSRWGVNRTVAQIHALLYLAGCPLDAEEITKTLGVARSNVSNSLKELQAWNLTRIVHLKGDRRDHYEVSTDVWELFKLIVAGRRQREIDPTIVALRECIQNPMIEEEDEGTRQRITETLEFIEIMSTLADEVLRMRPEVIMKTLGVSAKISQAMRKPQDS